MLKILFGLLFSAALYGEAYTNVCLSVSAPEDWADDVVEALTLKLNAIPNVKVVKAESDSAFTIAVDVNAVTDKGNEAVGYSMMALIYGTYDRRMLEALFAGLAARSREEKLTPDFEVLRYIVSGNIFLAATIHTQGSLDEIDSACDQIVESLKTKAIPELQRLTRMLSVKDPGTNTAPLKRAGSVAYFFTPN